MPYSSDIHNPLVSSLVRHIAPVRVLDIGAGSGKYATIIRSAAPTSHIAGVEIESDYVARFGLGSLYDEIRCIDAATLIRTSIDESWDLVIFGDSLEHLAKSTGIDLLHFLIYRTAFMLVLYPNRYIQGSVEGYVSEAHLSVWSAHDFSAFAHTPVLERDGQSLVVVEGFRAEPGALLGLTKLMTDPT